MILARSARRPRAPPFPEPTAQASAGGSQRTDGPPPVVIPPGDAMEADVPDRGHGELVPRAGGIDAGGGAVGVGGGLWIGGLGAGPRGEGMAGGMLERDGQMGLDLKVGGRGRDMGMGLGVYVRVLIGEYILMCSCGCALLEVCLLRSTQD